MTMPTPPFKLAASSVAPPSGTGGVAIRVDAGCCEGGDEEAERSRAGRWRLADLNPHFHCSVLGTCLGTADLRKLMARFIDVHGASDLDVHHEAVRLAADNAAVAKALNKALEQRHEAAVRCFARLHGEAALTARWQESLRQGEVPGAYWASLTHRDATPTLRQRVFGDVHMLSHLVGAANRADIRRLVAIENDNAELRDKLERHQARSQQLLEERDAAVELLRRHRLASAPACAAAEAPREPAVDVAALTAMVAVQTARRERAEGDAATASDEARRLQQELARLQEHAQALLRELAAAEMQMRETACEPTDEPRSLRPQLEDRRVLYVGGRPSSTPAIRALVLRHGGAFQHHDGGLEERKGLLESSVAWAQVVLFPVDCIDHDSAIRLKRLCARLDTPFVPLRSASVASFAAAIAAIGHAAPAASAAPRAPNCPRHG